MKINLEILDAHYLYAKKSLEELNTKELVPKMVFRRRLTRASKLVIELCSKVNFKNNRIIYGTSFGELLATSNILKAINENQAVSPTDFQNSVYNTAVGYTSILHKSNSEVLTVSSGDETSQKVLKVGAVKALDNDELLLICTETLDIPNIDEVNHCVEFLESAVVLKVKVTNKEATLSYENIDKCEGFPKSIEYMMNIAKAFKDKSSNIIEVEL